MITGKIEGNRLLYALPGEIQQRLAPNLRLVNLSSGTILHEPGEVNRDIYFPVDSILSLLHVTRDGATAGLATVGSEGLVGISSFMSGSSTPSRALVQSPGNAYRLYGKILNEEFKRDGETQRLMLLYTQSLITQIAQTVVCNRHHTIYQQLGRWLLLCLDRLQSDHIAITQEMIAGILGVRREGVTLAAKRMRNEGIIEYARGRITVPNRHWLERSTCECYAVIRRETLRLLPYLSGS